MELLASTFDGKDDFILRTSLDLTSLLDGLRKVITTDAVQKEFRIYETRPFGCIVDKLLVYAGQSVPRKRRNDYLDNRVMIMLHDHMNSPVDSFLEHHAFPDNLRRRQLPVVRVKITTKTMLENLDLREHVARHIRCASHYNGGDPPELRHIAAESEEMSHVYSYAMEGDWFNQVLMFLQQHNDTSAAIFTDSLMKLIEEVNPTPVAEIKKKLYVQRAQIRAYNVVKDIMLNIVSSIIQQMYQSKSFNTCANPISRIIPVRGKNLLNFKLPIGKFSNLTVALGDLSAFTATCTHTWIVLLWHYTQLISTGQGKLSERIYGEVKGEYFSFTLDEVFRIYLSRTIGCKVEYNGELFKILGGILGLKGNMSLTMIAFASLLGAKAATELSGFDYHLQIGGDDFILAVMGERSVVSDKLENIKCFITEYVGHLGEWSTVNIPSGLDMTLRDNRYCQKWVRAEWTQDCVRLRTLDKVPFMMDQFLQRHWDVDTHRAFVTGVYNVTRKFEPLNSSILTGVMAKLHLLRYGHRLDPRVTKMCVDTSLHHLVVGFYDGVSASDAAIRLGSNVKDKEYTNVRFRTTLLEKLQYLCQLPRGKVKTVSFQYEGFAYVTDAEKPKLMRETKIELDLPEDVDGVEELVMLYSSVIDKISEILPMLADTVEEPSRPETANLLIYESE